MNKMREKIDFVIMWVDGSDPKWLAEKNKYSEKKVSIDDGINRYRDMNLLKYWFRGVEKYTPWVNKIYFVTWGHLPEWLDTSNPKLVIVNHIYNGKICIGENWIFLCGRAACPV